MLLRRLAASTLAEAVTALAACASNGSSDKGGEGGARRRRAPKGATAIKPGKAGGKLTVLASADVDYLDPGPGLLHLRLHGPVRGQPDPVLVQARQLREAGRDLATGPPADLRRTTRRSPSTSSRGSSTRRRSTARSRPPTSSTPSSARSPRRSRAATPATYFSSIVGTPAKAEQRRHQADLGHRDARRPHDRLQAQGRQRAAGLPGAGDADHDAGARGVRGQVRQKHADRVRPVHAFTGPYMIKNDPKTGKVTGRVARQVDRHRAQPELGQGDRLPPGLPRRDRDPGGQRRPRHRGAPRARTARPRSAATRASRPPRSSSRRCSTPRTRSSSCPRAGRTTSRSTSKVKPFDNVDIRKAIIAATNRDALRLTRAARSRRPGQRLDPAGPAGLRGGRRPQAGHRPRLPQQPRRATRRWPRSTCWRPSSRTRACRSTPTASGPAARRS